MICEEHMMSIPEAILLKILSKLPVKSLLRFKCVDRLWCNLITSSYFISMHLHSYPSKYILVTRFDYSMKRPFISLLSLDTNQSPIDVELPSLLTSKVHSSCNGIVCLQGRRDQIGLWNPATRDFKLLPESNIYRSRFPTGMAAEVGFGFDPKTNDYKILQTVYITPYVDQFELYSLLSDSWKKLEPADCVRPSYDYKGATSLSFKNKNILCWIAADLTEPDYLWEIVSFDLSDEKFDIIQLPPNIATLAEGHNGMLFPFRDSIALLSYRRRVESFDVWVSENISTSGPSTYSWTKLCSIGAIDVASRFKNFPKGFLGNGQLIFHDGGEDVVLYDLHTAQEIKYLGGRRLYSFKAFEYNESLVAIQKLQN